MALTLEQSVAWRPDIGGWSREILPFYDRLAEELPAGARVVEVGVYQGRSLGYLAQRLHALGKACTLVGVDAYRWHAEDLEVTRKNLDSLDGGKDVALVVGSSAVAATLFASMSLDLVFIDGFHTYEEVRDDLIAWTRTVKLGGILAGHDYGEPAHPGVKQAVDEAFPGGVAREETVWSVRL